MDYYDLIVRLGSRDLICVNQNDHDKSVCYWIKFSRCLFLIFLFFFPRLSTAQLNLDSISKIVFSSFITHDYTRLIGFDDSEESVSVMFKACDSAGTEDPKSGLAYSRKLRRQSYENAYADFEKVNGKWKYTMYEGSKILKEETVCEKLKYYLIRIYFFWESKEYALEYGLYQIPVDVRLKTVLTLMSFVKQLPQPDVYEILEVDTPPEYPGGDGALFKFIRESLILPKDCPEVIGKIFIEFVIDTTGKVKDVKTKKNGGCSSVDKEIEEKMLTMPVWKPGSIKGRKVAVRFVIPINIHPK
jgi:hypothetical protein